jgi:SH3-like domain-containing protein
VAIDAKGAKPGAEAQKTVTLRFSPREDAPAVAVAMASDLAGAAPLEECRGWIRVEASGHIGWVRKEEVEAGDVRK